MAEHYARMSDSLDWSCSNSLPDQHSTRLSSPSSSEATSRAVKRSERCVQIGALIPLTMVITIQCSVNFICGVRQRWKPLLPHRQRLMPLDLPRWKQAAARPEPRWQLGNICFSLSRQFARVNRRRRQHWIKRGDQYHLEISAMGDLAAPDACRCARRCDRRRRLFLNVMDMRQCRRSR